MEKFLTNYLNLALGFVEAGTLTHKPQAIILARVIQLSSDNAVINRYSFNNKGIMDGLQRLKHKDKSAILGINIASIRILKRQMRLS